MRYLRFPMLTLFICALFIQTAQGAERFDPGFKFKTIPVLNEGRVKPLDSLARIYLKQFSGSDKHASAWFAHVLFMPHKAADIPVFKINDPQIWEQIGLQKKESRLYSFSEMANGLKATAPVYAGLVQQQAETLTSSQKAFVKLHEDVITFRYLLDSFGFLLPLSISPPAQIDIGNLPSDGLTYRDLAPYVDKSQEQLRDIIKQKGENLDRYDDSEARLALFLFDINNMEAFNNKNDLFRIFLDDASGGKWQSPWQIFRDTPDHPVLDHWEDMANGYIDSLNAETNQRFEDISAKLMSSQLSVQLEVFYKLVKPFRWAELFYAASLFAAIFYVFAPRRKIFLAVSAAAGAGFLLQLTGLISRIVILDRPPVGSLYESLLFVGLVIMGAALLMAYKRQEILYVAGGSFAALLLLLIAPAIAPEGDNLETLVAVLNTGFWLATHVICITAGYGVCILAAILAHFYLYRRVFGVSDDALFSLMFKTAMLALFFTAFGTMLGGIWADQSWGRFWGWDPKENGALLIVLWLVWLMHARLGAHMSKLTLAAGFAFVNVIVALAWFGVNLLSVGLHSYGFISGIAVGLAVFCSAQTLLIAALYLAARLKRAAP